MPRKSDEVEALAKVLYRTWGVAFRNGRFRPIPWRRLLNCEQKVFLDMARAAIAHLKPKRGAKRGKS